MRFVVGLCNLSQVIAFVSYTWQLMDNASLLNEDELIPREKSLLLIATFESVMLGLAKDTAVTTDVEDLVKSLMHVIGYIGQNPLDVEVRNSLRRVLSVEIAGSWALPFLIAAVLRFAHQPIGLCDSQLHSKNIEDYPDSEIKQSFTRAYSWLDQQSGVVMGVDVMPPELLTVPADALLQAVVIAIHDQGHQLSNADDVKTFETLLALGLSIAPLSINSAKLLDVVRLAASYLTVAGQVQHARDLVETAFMTVGKDDFLKRCAWFTFADVYQRLGMIEDAMLGLSCALAVRVPIPPEQAFAERYLTSRMLRDLKFLAEAKEFIPDCRKFLELVKLEEENEGRLNSLQLGIELLELQARDSIDQLAAQDVMRKATIHVERALALGEELLPATTNLAQAMNMAEAHGLSIEPHVKAVLSQSSEQMGVTFASLMTTLTALNPSAEDVLKLINSLEVARYGEDVGYDLRKLVGPAHRLLTSEEATARPDITAFAIETLADHAIEPRRVADENKFPKRPLISSLEETLLFAKELSAKNLTMVLVALDKNDRLVKLVVRQGSEIEVVVLPKEQFSAGELRKWAEKYPHQYGEAKDADNEVYLSMLALDLGEHFDQPTLFVPEVALQNIPPNIFMSNGELIGHSVPIAIVPSLSWLKPIVDVPPRSTGKRLAWISTEAKEHQYSMLENLAVNLSPVFVKHGFTLREEPNVPSDLNEADIVVIGAHGGLDADKKFFQAVADEANLHVPTSVLAKVIRGVDLVILFVCSGGRLDMHPTSNGTVGFVKQLLGQNCSAVIACPWPLSLQVPAPWFSAFMQAWD
ncbi:MAG: hypothetical protein EOP04_03265 [Proteobacteria bacterium]|nr:MAG: hypothetical protein EOP04_03265 [Pseudomonadota bacterium]